MRNITSLLATSAVLAIFSAGVAVPVSAQVMETPDIEPIETEAEDDDVALLVAQARTEVARENGWYVSLAPNLVFGYPVDIESDGPVAIVTAPIFPGAPAVVANIPVDISLDTETGFGINGAVGYRFDDARMELEVAYNNNNVDGVTVNNLAEIPLDGDIKSTQFMVNGYYDMPTNSRFSPYIGGGVGVATLNANNVEANVPGLGALALDDTGVSFVFQVKAGVNYAISDQASAFLGYRLHGIPGQGFEAFGADFDADTLLVHSVQLGAQYQF
ncbi:outer membrane protein [Leptothoe sp. PORK10 BA2]|uniref:outer membrane protein n=1 Tax=Leptothoe sp. PORK10 BA2 TaxID=3110254 RepID=UPI002B1ED89C|nr:P44/Msp2 family outer membrane protein [Leptothoe sp. PORK10 BA2]MEA5463328.1 P44/Msp2 family outer membrane protein [Leptothoe sp. PORK10 BA2]